MDDPQLLIYADPPYPRATRSSGVGQHGYKHQMSDAEHRALAEALNAAHAMVVLSGYACPLYEELYGRWHRDAIATHADRGSPRTEVLWLNPAAQRAQRQMSLLA